MEDTYESRALFLMMWHGAPSTRTRKAFPEWSDEANALQTNSTEETMWFVDFCAQALSLRGLEGGAA